jgi:hypothetical protein
MNTREHFVLNVWDIYDYEITQTRDLVVQTSH